VTLWGRQFAITVDDIRFGIDFMNDGPYAETLGGQFQVSKTLEPEANTANLAIYNLNKDHRRQLNMLASTGVFVEIEAGYIGNTGRIYRGWLRDVYSQKDGPTWVTAISSGDSEDRLAKARTNRAYAAGTQVDDILKDVLDDMGVGLGNALSAIRTGNLREAGREFINACVVSGSSKKQLERLLKSIGKEWSIQDGELQVIDRGTCLPGPTIRIDSTTGMVGSPTVGNDGILRFRSLLNHEIVPGRALQVKSSEVSEAYYRAERCEYTCDTAGGKDWYVDVEAALYVPALYAF